MFSRMGRSFTGGNLRETNDQDVLAVPLNNKRFTKLCQICTDLWFHCHLLGSARSKSKLTAGKDGTFE